MRPATLALAALLAACGAQTETPAPMPTEPSPLEAPPPPVLRVATYNVSLHGAAEGDLLRRLDDGDAKARKVAATIQHLRPDLLLLNEFDYDAAHAAADRFQREYLETSQDGQAPIQYPYRFLAPVNTGVSSGLDLDRDGQVELPGDGWGFGQYPGQYGMLVLSRHPIDVAAVRTFQQFRWSAMPDALAPMLPDSGEAWYPPEVWEQFRLSSKSHWDVPVDTPIGRVHFLVSHPTPPVFDGPEDRNGRRNHDEIRFWAEYVSGQARDWIVDDAGRRGGLDPAARFVIAGDQNADPVDGDSVEHAIRQLLEHPRILRHEPPSSRGGALSSAERGGVNLDQRGDPAHDTGAFSPRTGNLRIDYVLPSLGFEYAAGGVFWPLPGEIGADWIEASDHRPVWIDLRQARPASAP